MRLRVVIARCGEMDAMEWWNTEGQLGSFGARVLRRGFPRTHYFAQARSVFAVAAQRSTQVFDPKAAATLWRIGNEVDEAFDAQWEGWLDSADEWKPFFESVQALSNFDITCALTSLSLVDAGDIEAAQRLKVDGGAKGVLVPGPFDLGRNHVALLALGYAKGAQGELVVPYSPFAGKA
jgi:hypothetical protein